MYHATRTASHGVTGANEGGHGVSVDQESVLSPPPVKAVQGMAQHQIVSCNHNSKESEV